MKIDMRMILLRPIGPMALIIAVQVLSQSVHKPNDVSSGNLDLYEAVIRYQIKSWQQAAHTYCVEINGADPNPALLQRLRPLHVRGASACQKLIEKRLMRVVDGKMKGSVIFNTWTRPKRDRVPSRSGRWLCLWEPVHGTGNLPLGSRRIRLARIEVRSAPNIVTNHSKIRIDWD